MFRCEWVFKNGECCEHGGVKHMKWCFGQWATWAFPCHVSTQRSEHIVFFILFSCKKFTTKKYKFRWYELSDKDLKKDYCGLPCGLICLARGYCRLSSSCYFSSVSEQMFKCPMFVACLNSTTDPNGLSLFLFKLLLQKKFSSHLFIWNPHAHFYFFSFLL